LNGLLIQWGTIIPTSQATKDGTLTFPIVFSQIPFFQATRRLGNSDSTILNQDRLAIGYVSKTTAKYDADYGSPYDANKSLILDWFAIGY